MRGFSSAVLEHGAVSLLYGVSLLCAGACSGRPVPGDGTSDTSSAADPSTGSDPATTMVLSTSAEDGDTTGVPQPGTTGGPVGDGHLRLLAGGVHEGMPGLYYVEYQGGVLDPPLAIGEPVTDAAAQLLAVAPSGSFAGYRLPGSRGGFGVKLLDLRDGIPSVPAVVDVPTGVEPIWLRFLPGDEGIVFASGPPWAGAWTAALHDGVPEPVQLVVAPPPRGRESQVLHEIAQSGEWLLSQSGPTDPEGPANLYLASIVAPDPANPVQLSEIQMPGVGPEHARVLPGDVGVVYLAPGDLGANELWLVPLLDQVPGVPQRISADLAAGDLWGVQNVHVSPAGNGLVYWTHDSVGAGFGPPMWVALDGTDAAPPVALGLRPLSEDYAGRVRSAPDGGWVVFRARDERLDSAMCWLVDVSGAAPTEPVRVGGALEHIDVDEPRFDATSTFLYFTTAEVFGEDAALSRIRLDNPAEPQSVGGSMNDGGGLAGVVAFTPDEQFVAYTTRASPSTLSIVDLSGSEPAITMMIDVPLAEGDTPYRGWFSADGSVLAFGVRSEGAELGDLWLVDLSAPEGAMPVLASAGDPSILPN